MRTRVLYSEVGNRTFEQRTDQLSSWHGLYKIYVIRVLSRRPFTERHTKRLPRLYTHEDDDIITKPLPTVIVHTICIVVIMLEKDRSPIIIIRPIWSLLNFFSKSHTSKTLITDCMYA